MNDDQAVDTQADAVDEEAAHASIRSELSDGILTITLDRAAKGNALRPSDRRQVIALLQSAHETAAVRCVVLRAAGGTSAPVRTSPASAEQTPRRLSGRSAGESWAAPSS